MRISTSWAQQTSVNSMLNQQSRLNQTQLQMNAGKKILTPSDDPAAASRIIDLNQSIKQTEQYQSNNDAARQRLTLEDGVLQSSVDILNRIEELGVQGLNATYNQSDRATIATEMEELNKQLVGYANTQNANGEYLFSGFKSTTQPFSKSNIVAGSVMAVVLSLAPTGTIIINGVATGNITTTANSTADRDSVIKAINDANVPGVTAMIDTDPPGSGGVRLEAADGRNIAAQFTGTLTQASTGVAAATAEPIIYVGTYRYAGDNNQRSIQIGETRKITDGDPGINVFGAPTPTTSPVTAVPPPGSIANIFEAIDQFAKDLRTNTPKQASLGDVSSALGKILNAQSSVGARLNALDSQEGFNTDYILNTKTVLSATEDLDYAEAISRFSQQTLALQASQQAFAQVKKLSLFNYL